MHLIRFSAIEDKETLLNSICQIYESIEKVQKLGYQKGVIKLHYNGPLSTQYFEVVKQAKINNPNLRSLLKVRLAELLKWEKEIEETQDEVMLRDNISLTPSMIEFSQKDHNYKLILQVRANGDENDPQYIQALQKNGKPWKLNPHNPSDEKEDEKIARALDTTKEMPSNISSPGKATEKSYWINDDGTYNFDTSLYIKKQETGGRNPQRTAEYNDYYDGIKRIQQKLT